MLAIYAFSASWACSLKALPVVAEVARSTAGTDRTRRGRIIRCYALAREVAWGKDQCVEVHLEDNVGNESRDCAFRLAFWMLSMLEAFSEPQVNLSGQVDEEKKS